MNLRSEIKPNIRPWAVTLSSYFFGDPTASFTSSPLSFFAQFLLTALYSHLIWPERRTEFLKKQQQQLPSRFLFVSYYSVFFFPLIQSALPDICP